LTKCFCVRYAEHNRMNDDDTHSVTDTMDSITTQDLQKPILVGYAFGAKKMNTMATVMAEASRACVVGVVSVHNQEAPLSSPNSLTTAALCRHQEKEAQHPKSIVVSQGGLNNIVRYFRSSCSSVGSDDEFGSNTSTTGTGTITTTTRKTHSSHASASSTYPVRVSFVPVDLNDPLEEQHGGRFDIILHKMTEDILCLSTADMRWKQLLDERGDITCKLDSCEPTLGQAIRRIHRLKEYQRSNPQCCLADDPTHVEVVMSRSAISSKLHFALVGVTSASGVPAATPRFVDYDRRDRRHSLRYPLIAKPLPAAGTTKSHCMGIVLNPKGLEKIDVPCLLQEYANHRSTLHKVYVLGDDIHVFSRLSLPDLPRDKSELELLNAYVEFDSQRPYPKLSDFGLQSIPQPANQIHTLQLTPAEVSPIVVALKRAFGLELFGFDILVSGNCMLVVDVNYFPSFKEVSNFPSLLAKFLVQRAVQTRKSNSQAT
jgi:inositol-1,3,4-trisphosphate 5/6-kinase / inositol-tetrakisphosphate 1-kinase